MRTERQRVTKRSAIPALGLLAIFVACSEQFPQPNERNAPPPPPAPWGLDDRPISGCVPPAGTPSKALVAFERLTMFPLKSPVEIATQGGRIYVVEQGGTIRILPKDGSTPPLVLDISGKIIAGGEAGLLGMAFHPKFAENGFIYLYFTAPHTQTPAPPNVAFQSVLARYTSNDGGLTIDAASEKRILVVDQPYGNHNGGTILFGKDGFLYWGLGDGGSGGDPENRAQNPNELLGKMLRIDVDGGDPYAIPDSNPYATSGGQKEIYASGLRNPYRFRFDDATGDLWAGDVGQGMREEISKITLGGNYGWPIREGTHCYKPALDCNTPGLIDPVVEHGRTEATSITGGVVYRGTKVPAMTGRYVYGDFGTSNIWGLTQAPPLLLNEDLPRINPSAFSLDPDGEVLVASYSHGTVYRIVPAPPPATAPLLLSETGCVNPLDPTKPVVGLFPYDVAVPQWMDGATADRYLALPRDTQLKLADDGKLELPPNSVALRFIKNARGIPVEVQLLSKDGAGGTGAYRYVWETGERDARLDTAASQQCLLCHDPKANMFTIGLEVAQLDHAGADYGNGRTGNPLKTLEHLAMLDRAPPADLRTLAPLDGFAATELRARSYLHANCAYCHRGGEPTTLDLRHTTPLRSTQACDVPGKLTTGGRVTLAPGNPDESQIITSMKATGEGRMPPAGTSVPHDAAIRIVSEWIRDLRACD